MFKNKHLGIKKGIATLELVIVGGIMLTFAAFFLGAQMSANENILGDGTGALNDKDSGIIVENGGTSSLKIDSMVFSPNEINVSPGNSIDVSLIIRPDIRELWNNLEFKSANSAVATSSFTFDKSTAEQKVTINGVSPGVTAVTVKSLDQGGATAIIKVRCGYFFNQDNLVINLSNNSPTSNSPFTATLGLQGVSASLDFVNIEWEITDVSHDVASTLPKDGVTNSSIVGGLISGSRNQVMELVPKQGGTFKIKARVHDTIFDTHYEVERTVKVEQFIQMSQSDIQVTPGSTKSVNLTMLPSLGNSWNEMNVSSNNDSIARASANFAVNNATQQISVAGLSVGNTVVRANAKNGSAQAQFNVRVGWTLTNSNFEIVLNNGNPNSYTDFTATVKVVNSDATLNHMNVQWSIADTIHALSGSMPLEAHGSRVVKGATSGVANSQITLSPKQGGRFIITATITEPTFGTTYRVSRTVDVSQGWHPKTSSPSSCAYERNETMYRSATITGWSGQYVGAKGIIGERCTNNVCQYPYNGHSGGYTTTNISGSDPAARHVYQARTQRRVTASTTWSTWDAQVDCNVNLGDPNCKYLATTGWEVRYAGYNKQGGGFWDAKNMPSNVFSYTTAYWCSINCGSFHESQWMVDNAGMAGKYKQYNQCGSCTRVYDGFYNEWVPPVYATKYYYYNWAEWQEWSAWADCANNSCPSTIGTIKVETRNAWYPTNKIVWGAAQSNPITETSTRVVETIPGYSCPRVRLNAVGQPV